MQEFFRNEAYFRRKSCGEKNDIVFFSHFFKLFIAHAMNIPAAMPVLHRHGIDHVAEFGRHGEIRSDLPLEREGIVDKNLWFTAPQRAARSIFTCFVSQVVFPVAEQILSR